MRTPEWLALCALLAVPRAAAAKPSRPSGPPRATLRCSTSAGEEVSRARSRLTEPLACAVAVSSDGRFNAVVQARGRDRSGPDRAGHVEQRKPLKVDLKPGTDFSTCSDFEVFARLEDDAGRVLWTQRLAVRQGCAPRRIKADFSCAVEREGRAVPLPAKGNPGLRSTIRCALTSRDAAFAQSKATLAIDAGGRRSLREAEPASDGSGWAARFELAPGADFDPCARAMTLTAEVAVDGAPAFGKVLALRQDCKE